MKNFNFSIEEEFTIIRKNKYRVFADTEELAVEKMKAYFEEIKEDGFDALMGVDEWGVEIVTHSLDGASMENTEPTHHHFTLALFDSEENMLNNNLLKPWDPSDTE